MTRPDLPDLPVDLDLDVDRDPDPTPTATAWQEYLAAAQSLDVIRREAAAASAAATRAASSARAELAELTARLEQQRARLTGAATRVRVPLPRLAPTPAEPAPLGDQAAEPANPAAVPPPGNLAAVPPPGNPAAALARCRELIEAADRELPGAGSAAGWPPPRWLLVAVPLGIAAVLACAALLLLVALR